MAAVLNPPRPRILVVDDERNVHYSFRRALDGEYVVESAHDGAEAMRRLRDDPPDAVLLDVKLPDQSGLDTLASIRERHPAIPVVVMTAYGTTDTAIRATALSARDYLLKPVDVPALRTLLAQILPTTIPAQNAQERNASRSARAGDLPARFENRIAPGEGSAQERPSREDEPPSSLLGRSPSMHELYKMIGRAAATQTTVLVTGESGTGKELVARAIHAHGSARSAGPLVALNCAAIPDSLLEVELFGHERGAFTGADAPRPGKFELADGGTLLLDEIGEMRPPLQAKLLRVLQEGETVRLGASETRRFDVRVIAMTNVDLERRVAAGAFREDLYYRLNVLRISVPALRDRDGDVLLLAHSFLERERRRAGRALVGFTAEAEQQLREHAWPGNVRELENAIARATLRARGDRITGDDLALRVVRTRVEDGGEEDAAALLDHALARFLERFPGETLEPLERAAFAKALAATEGNQVRAAKLLGTTRNVVRNRIAKHRL
jgi:DNA-binding NtrC family response regulator